MPLLDHFHPPLHGPRRWEGFHHAWASFIAFELNKDLLAADYFAEPDIGVGPLWEKCESLAFQVVGNRPILRAAVEIVGPANKDSPSRRQSFVAKCARYLQRGIGVVIVDTVKTQSTNLTQELFELLSIKEHNEPAMSATGLFAIAFRGVPTSNSSRLEVWVDQLAIGRPLPVMPLWLNLELCVPLRLEECYLTACKSLRISA